MVERLGVDSSALSEAALRDAVLDTRALVALLDFSSRRFLEFSPAAYEELGFRGADLRTLDMVELAGDRDAAVQFVPLVRDGHITRWNWRGWFNAPDGRLIDYSLTGRAFTLENSRRVGVVVYEVKAGRPAGATVPAGNWMPIVDVLEDGIGALDTAGDVPAVAHVADPTLAAGLGAQEREGDGRAVADERSALLFAAQRLAQLERHLSVIAREVAGAQIAHERRIPPVLQGLSERQQEIVSRLLAGERVPTIARKMYLNQKTVRTHLSNVFRRFGVHSQAELLEHIRARDDR